MPIKIRPTFFEVTFYGNTTAGSFSVPGVKAGDVIISVRDAAGNSGYPDDGSMPRYRQTVTTDDELEQMAPPMDHSSERFSAILVRWS